MNKSSKTKAAEVSDTELDRINGGAENAGYGYAGVAYDNADLLNHNAQQLNNGPHSGHTGLQAGFKKVARNVADTDVRNDLQYPSQYGKQGLEG
ncbi:MAG: hypothetical protein AAGH68_01320 [Pseudomonadota bacterium]